MCGRFSLWHSGEEVAQAFGLSKAPDLAPRYNIAPSQPVLAIAMRDGQRAAKLLRWGLVPSWSNDPSLGVKLINARAETLAEKPSFRQAFQRRRCLIPADGFYEWQAVDRQKQPHYFYLHDRQLFAMAGLWERWQGADGSELQTCTIVTTAANALLQPIHDRMPVILTPEECDRWLDPTQTRTDLEALLQPFDEVRACGDRAMASHPVGKQVNNGKLDSEQCIQPLG